MRGAFHDTPGRLRRSRASRLSPESAHDTWLKGLARRRKLRDDFFAFLRPLNGDPTIPDRLPRACDLDIPG
jgi:hypothetical protein